jgi:GNAT superfamily N-acetyltransferase
MADAHGRRGLTLRALDRRDLPRLLELARPACPELALELDDLVRQVLEDPGGDESLRLGAFAGELLVAAAVAVVRRGATAVGHWKLLVGETPWSAAVALVHDAVAEALRDAGALTIETDGAAPMYLLPGLRATDSPGTRFLGARGYRETERRASMSAVLGDELLAVPLEPSRLESGIVLRRAVRADAELLDREITRLFSAAWAFEAVASVERDPVGTHVALGNGRLAGFATAGLWARNAFGPMGTAPELERRGIGAALLRRCLADLRWAGQQEAVISWVGPEAFYERHAGAKRTLEYVVLEKRLGP